jgi:hypothetical protein
VFTAWYELDGITSFAFDRAECVTFRRVLSDTLLAPVLNEDAVKAT